ncbi:hypothetical protein HU200_037469 [Digitaria exilis]|uniref:C2H2-type domain-containing protein n=1 Tax=Digitaria exilis TaxID=1010633 RepID=A0A835EJ65_9POAL|nr:hypothetical protein HU200_037469 [Digitaria exilis]
MERDGGHIKLQQLSRSDNFSLAASSWPPQQKRSSSSSSHTCGYCKREFRSAQGLGGHMNVHRMDRARLIHHQCSSHLLDLLSSGCRCCRTHGAASDGGSLAMPTAKLGISRSSAMTITTKDFDVKNLELRMGACSHGDGAEERLDLELKLGYS